MGGRRGIETATKGMELSPLFSLPPLAVPLSSFLAPPCPRALARGIKS